MAETDVGDAQFGARLRTRRRQLGLSQIELAGEDLSGSYVSLLESGRRRPTLRAARTLAARLGCSADYLLHGDDPAQVERFRLGVRYAQMALRNGEGVDALSQLDALLADTGSAPAALVREARGHRARALETLGRLSEAADELTQLDREAVAARRLDDHLRLTIDLVRCHQEAGDVSLAVDRGTAALEELQALGLDGTDLHAELVSTVIGAYYLRGDLLAASRLARDAVERVSRESSPRARGAVYWNASLVAEAAGKVSEAVLLAERALALYADGDDERALARLRIAYGWLLLRTEPPQPQKAQDELHAAQSVLVDVGSDTDLAYCETELARAALLLGDGKSALAHVEKAQAWLSNEARLESAYALLVRAAALLSLDRREEAVAAYREAARTLSSLDASREAAAAWRELADAFTELGLLGDATLAYQQALSELGIRAAPRPTERSGQPASTGSPSRAHSGKPSSSRAAP